MNEQLNDYINRAFDYEECGKIEEAIQICEKCLKKFPDYQNEIELEIAKMSFRNGRKEHAFLQFLTLYLKTQDETLCDFILDAYYFSRKDEWDRNYQENCKRLENYAHYYGKRELPEISCYPLWVGERNIWYFDAKARAFRKEERCLAELSEPLDTAWLGENLLWLEDIYYLEQKTRMRNPFLDMENPLMLIYDKDQWELFLQLHNIEELIVFDRIVFYTDIQGLEESIFTDGICVPKMFLGKEWDKYSAVLEGFHNKYLQKKEEYTRRAVTYYKINKEKVAQNILQGKPKILFITSLFTTALQYHTRDCSEAVRDMGLEAEIVIEKNRLCRLDASVLTMKKIVTFQPDIIFFIDHFRFEYQSFMRGLDSIVWICWAQDPLDLFLSNDTALKLKERDIVVSEFYSWKKFLNVKYNKERLIYYPLVASHKIYHSYTLSEKEKENYKSDICLICHKIPAEEYAEAFAGNFQGKTRNFIRDLYLSYIEYVRRTDHLFMKEEDYELYICEYIGAKLNCDVSPDEIAIIVDDMSKHFKCLLYREQIADWLIDAGYTNLKFWGNGWEKTEKYRPYAMGAAENGEVMSKILQTSKIVIGNNAYLTGPSRVAETLLSGAFYLGNEIPPELDVSDIRYYLKEGEDVIFWKNKEDLLSKIKFYLDHEEERQNMAAAGQKKALKMLTYQKFMENILNRVTEMFS